nr:MAG TPA: Guanyl-specific ribonuclease Sa [Caudoviricetes sp.]
MRRVSLNESYGGIYYESDHYHRRQACGHYL